MSFSLINGEEADEEFPWRVGTVSKGPRLTLTNPC